jgi:hypothetical protein
MILAIMPPRSGSWLCRLIVAILAVALGRASSFDLAAQSTGPSKNFDNAVKNRLKTLEKNRKEASREGGEITKRAIQTLRSKDPEELQWHERGRDAAGAWLQIVSDEQAVLEELRREGPEYGRLSRRGDHAQARASRFSDTEQKLASLETDAIKRLAATRSRPRNAEQYKALETEQLVLQKARVALEEERTTIEFVLLNTGRETMAQIQKRQEEHEAASRAYYKRLHEEHLRDMQIGGAIVGGIIILGALGQALQSTEGLNEIRRWTCEKQLGGTYVVPGDPKQVLGHCV